MWLCVKDELTSKNSKLFRPLKPENEDCEQNHIWRSYTRERLQKEMISINISYLNYLNDTYVSLEASLTGPATQDFSP